MATATTKKTRRLLKKEVMFTSRRLQKLDLDVMEAFVVKEMEAVESHDPCTIQHSDPCTTSNSNECQGCTLR